MGGIWGGKILLKSIFRPLKANPYAWRKAVPATNDLDLASPKGCQYRGRNMLFPENKPHKCHYFLEGIILISKYKSVPDKDLEANKLAI